MSSVTYNHPLKLPEGWTETPVNSGSHQSPFSKTLTIDEVLRYMEDEIRSLDMSATLYTNYQQLNNSRLRKQIGRSSGVAIIIQSGNDKYHFACDKWARLEHNIYALHLAVRVFINLEKWGIASADFAMSAISNGSQPKVNISSDSNNTFHSSAPDWMAALGLGVTATLEDANAIYRRRAKLLASDEAALLELNNSMDEARKYLR